MHTATHAGSVVVSGGTAEVLMGRCVMGGLDPGSQAASCGVMALGGWLKGASSCLCIAVE